MKNKISAYLSHLQTLAAEGKIETLIVVDVQRNPEGEPVSTVGAFAEDIDQDAAGRMAEHMRGIAQLQADISGIDEELPNLQLAIDSAVTDINYSLEVLDAAVHAYTQDPTPENKTAMETVQGGVRDAEKQLLTARRAKSLAELRKTSAQKAIQFLSTEVQDLDETDAWCADYSEDLAGEVGNIDFIHTDKAHFFPVGVPGLFVNYYAPANYVETVNTLALPKYVKSANGHMDKFVDLEAQSNPLPLCTRPKALIQAKRT